MSLEHLQQVVAKLAASSNEEKEPGRTPTNQMDTIGGTNHVNRTAAETTGMDGSPTGYMWRQNIPEDKPSTSGRVPGLEVLTSGSEKIVADQNMGMLDRLFTDIDEARRVDRELIAKNFDAGSPGKYVTRSKTLLENVRGTTGERLRRPACIRGTRDTEEKHVY